MSAPPKKKRVSGKKKEAESKRVVKEKAPKPSGTPPTAVVEVRHGRGMTQRQARGFSLGEVAQAGLDFGLARRWGLLVDDRRRSTLEGNVASLKRWSSQTKKTAEERVEGEVRKIEKAVVKEVRKAEKEVKKEAKKAEKDVEKVGKEVVEKEVKKEAKKAEKDVEKVGKEVVEKVEAPIKKRSKKKKAAAKSKTP